MLHFQAMKAGKKINRFDPPRGLTAGGGGVPHIGGMGVSTPVSNSWRDLFDMKTDMIPAATSIQD
jgi:hypothetical protein